MDEYLHPTVIEPMQALDTCFGTNTCIYNTKFRFVYMIKILQNDIIFINKNKR